MDNVKKDWADNYWIAKEDIAIITTPDDSDGVLILKRVIPDAQPTE